MELSMTDQSMEDKANDDAIHRDSRDIDIFTKTIFKYQTYLWGFGVLGFWGFGAKW